MDYASFIPDDESLKRGLKSIAARGKDDSSAGLTILSRERNVFSSTYASEVIRCRLKGHQEILIHSKYSGNLDPWGHHRGIKYEGRVYEQVLSQVPVTAPRFYGVHKDGRTGYSWLFIEHIDNALRLHTTVEAMVGAAHWLGQFHASTSDIVGLPRTEFLEEYDGSYFRRCAGQTGKYASHLGSEFRWVGPLCQHFSDHIKDLSCNELTITHGEFYPKNILVKDEDIFPVDWESAVVTRGEIDLASLVEGWDIDTIVACKKTYQDSRWPEGSPADFEKVFKLASLFWPIRWLGDRDDWDLDDFARKYFDHLQDQAQKQALV